MNTSNVTVSAARKMSTRALVLALSQRLGTLDGMSVADVFALNASRRSDIASLRKMSHRALVLAYVA